MKEYLTDDQMDILNKKDYKFDNTIVTVSDILSVLPKLINCNYDSGMRLSIEAPEDSTFDSKTRRWQPFTDKWTVTYYQRDIPGKLNTDLNTMAQYECYKSFTGDELIDALFEALCWCIDEEFLYY